MNRSQKLISMMNEGGQTGYQLMILHDQIPFIKDSIIDSVFRKHGYDGPTYVKSDDPTTSPLSDWMAWTQGPVLQDIYVELDALAKEGKGSPVIPVPKFDELA